MRFEAPICGVWMWQPEQTAQRPRGDAGGPGAPAGDPLGGLDEAESCRAAGR